MEESQIAFGDRVRIRSTEASEKLGIAGLTGNVQGRTTPSVTGVEVVGKSTKDIAVSVRLDGRATSLWLAEELLELLDHAAGTTVEIAGRKLIRDERGEWREIKPN